MIRAMLQDLIQTLFKDRMFDCFITHHVTKDQQKRLYIQSFSSVAFRDELVDVIVLL